MYQWMHKRKDCAFGSEESINRTSDVLSSFFSIPDVFLIHRQGEMRTLKWKGGFT